MQKEILITEIIIHKAILDTDTNTVETYAVQSNKIQSIFSVESNKYLKINDSVEIIFN